jgi:protein-S-isoprenylcysteine O-methyltransferase Ste14
MGRIVALGYGVAAYVVFLGTFLYTIGFVGNVGVPKSIDSGAEGSVGQALLINTLLLVLFTVQHSGMARQGFKQWWTKFVPQPIERSTYVLLSSLALLFLLWQWRPMGGIVWEVDGPVGRLVLRLPFGLGCGIVLVSTFLLNHFDLFGLRQVYFYLSGKEYTPLEFKTPGLYRYVRHPLYVGWLFFFWATPTMTAAHLVLALLMTAYILVAIQFEERDLVRFYGHAYEDYRQRVPMLMPRVFRKKEIANQKVAQAKSSIA